MKYAKFSDEFLSYFRLDDNGETLVLTDKRGYSRAVKLLIYEERLQGDLISREALKKEIKNSVPYVEQERILEIIDNAPTVEPEEKCSAAPITSKMCGRCKYRNEFEERPRIDGSLGCSKWHYLTNELSTCSSFEPEEGGNK